VTSTLPVPIATDRYAGTQSGDTGASSKPTDRSIGMNASRSRPLTSLYAAGPFSMGYVDFYTFLIQFWERPEVQFLRATRR
jgi:hypothetical protein